MLFYAIAFDYMNQHHRNLRWAIHSNIARLSLPVEDQKSGWNTGLLNAVNSSMTCNTAYTIRASLTIAIRATPNMCVALSSLPCWFLSGCRKLLLDEKTYSWNPICSDVFVNAHDVVSRLVTCHPTKVWSFCENFSELTTVCTISVVKRSWYELSLFVMDLDTQ